MDVEAFERILPPMTEANRPYWDGLAAGELRLQVCTSDRTYRFPQSPVCPACLSPDFTWQPVSGRARLWSWIVMHQRYFEAFDGERPYPVAFVQLEEGPFMMSTVVGDPATLSVDADVTLTFKPVGTRRIPCFRIAS